MCTNKPIKLIQDLITEIQSYQDLEYLQLVRRSVPTRMKMIGIRGENLREILKN